jgi:hypothetical protein
LGFENREAYDACVADPARFREHIETQYRAHPELFPDEMSEGFSLHDRRTSVKLNVVVRRIQLRASNDTYQVRPSLVMPYMVALTDDVEKALYLRHSGVSSEALAYG